MSTKTEITTANLALDHTTRRTIECMADLLMDFNNSHSKHAGQGSTYGAMLRTIKMFLAQETGLPFPVLWSADIQWGSHNSFADDAQAAVIECGRDYLTHDTVELEWGDTSVLSELELSELTNAAARARRRSTIAQVLNLLRSMNHSTWSWTTDYQLSKIHVSTGRANHTLLTISFC